MRLVYYSKRFEFLFELHSEIFVEPMWHHGVVLIHYIWCIYDMGLGNVSYSSLLKTYYLYGEKETWETNLFKQTVFFSVCGNVNVFELECVSL